MISGPEIHRQIGLGNIKIDPFDPKRLSPNSYDLRLGPTLLLYDTGHDPIVVDRSGKADVAGLTYTREEDVEYVYLNDTVKVRVLDMKKDNPTKRFTIPEEGLILLPGNLYLGHTMEVVEAHGYAPLIDGRSSVGRLGMEIHISAGFFDDGFRGTATLEITVAVPLRVYAGVRLCQISFHPLEGKRMPYNGKYNGQREPVPSRLWKDFVNEDHPREAPPT